MRDPSEIASNSLGNRYDSISVISGLCRFPPCRVSSDLDFTSLSVPLRHPCCRRIKPQLIVGLGIQLHFGWGLSYLSPKRFRTAIKPRLRDHMPDKAAFLDAGIKLLVEGMKAWSSP
jgi:hypothetical protein